MVPLLNFISQNNVFEKISKKNKKYFFWKNLRKKNFFEKISESCFFVFLEKSQKKIFLFFKKKSEKKSEKKILKKNIFWSNFFSRHTQKRRHHSHTKPKMNRWGCHMSQILAEIHRVRDLWWYHPRYYRGKSNFEDPSCKRNPGLRPGTNTIRLKSRRGSPIACAVLFA